MIHSVNIDPNNVLRLEVVSNYSEYHTWYLPVRSWNWYQGIAKHTYKVNGRNKCYIIISANYSEDVLSSP